MLSFVSPRTKQRIRELWAERFTAEELAIMWGLSERRIKGLVKGVKQVERI